MTRKTVTTFDRLASEQPETNIDRLARECDEITGERGASTFHTMSATQLVNIVKIERYQLTAPQSASERRFRERYLADVIAELSARGYHEDGTRNRSTT